jgi:archaellum biogenesis ATPase FlaH
MSISKEQILQKISSYDILSFYLKNYHNLPKLETGKNISNPFLPEKQKTPSFNIHCALPSHEWRYKDFATGDEGSCFDLVMKLYNLSFPEAIKKINDDFNLNLEDSKNSSNGKYTIAKRPMNKAEMDFWKQYGIEHDTLLKFKVCALSEFSNVSKEGKEYTIKSSNEKFIFAYENKDWLKLYKPLDDKKYKFQYLGNKEPNFIFGWEQLPEKGEKVFITGGEKDVLTLAAHGFHAISLNSETSNIDNNSLVELRNKFEKIIVLYDNDNTGVVHSEKIASSYGLYKLTLPELPNNGKDISDFYKQNGSLEQFNELISETLKSAPKAALNEDKSVYNAVELLALGNLEPQYLMSPILPQKGTAVLAGKPDTGKSQFVRQLCIQIANGIPKFLDFDLNIQHQSAIYVSTEDGLEATSFLLNKQLKGLEVTAKENLRFMIADTLEQEEILDQLDKELTKQKADLVIVDSFGDIFKGGDSNNNMAMRNTVKIFDKVAKKHDCLIMFVHHINKGAYRVAPGQEHIQGGAGLLQKVRLGIQLSEGEGNLRYFTVVKGNYCPKEYKENTIILEFSEDNFLFNNTGKLIPTSDINNSNDKERKDEKYNDLLEKAEAIFNDKIVNSTNFVKEYCNITGKSIPTAKRAIKNMKESGIIVSANGGYRLNNESSFENDEDEDDENPTNEVNF